MTAQSHTVGWRLELQLDFCFYANSVSLSVKEKRLVREGFTEEEVLELPTRRAPSTEE